jgi:hypothetical protein
MKFWHDAITDKSFYTLQQLRKEYDFVLIGGWAVYFYTRALKSKDIDLVVDFETLGQLKTVFEVFKNDRLKKYEIKLDGFDVDIYLPHWSALGIPIEDLARDSVLIEGFRVPIKETLLALKLYAYRERKASLKGKKDALDIISLLYFNEVSWQNFHLLLRRYGLTVLREELRTLLAAATAVPELLLNRKAYSDFKKRIMPRLSG